jgi:hypothetical protein
MLLLHNFNNNHSPFSSNWLVVNVNCGIAEQLPYSSIFNLYLINIVAIGYYNTSSTSGLSDYLDTDFEGNLILACVDA